MVASFGKLCTLFLSSVSEMRMVSSGPSIEGLGDLGGVGGREVAIWAYVGRGDMGDEAGGVARPLAASWTAWTSWRMAFVVGCVVGSCCNEASVFLASRGKARRVGV
jgi:hypothetical protein